MQKKPRILSIDLGYSSVKYSYFDENGLLVNEKFISSVAKLPEQPLMADQNSVFSLNGCYYVLAESALKLDRSLLMPLESYNDMKEVYPVVISYVLKKLGNQNWSKVCLGLSMAFSDKADDLLDYLYTALLIDRSNNYFLVYPQGLACRYCYDTYKENPRDPAVHSSSNTLSNAVICDGGFLSLDLCAIIDHKSAAGQTIGLENTGVLNISRELANYIYKNYEYRISIKEAQVAVDSRQIVRRGRTIDLTDIVDKLSKQYLISVLNLIEEKYSNYLDVVEGILFVGGISYFMSRALEDPEFCNEVEKHYPVSFIHCPKELGEYYNSIGYLLLTEDLLKKGKIQ
jgi:hypothetical protein